ncbi:MAG: MerR family DNA-binding transcriptional regulator [Anaerolineales bacterium]|nr:MerR family DNA-binding transcriptional regulator [Anaerolineales bacterium]
MAKEYLFTSDLAKAVGIHPNTVRLYEQWGLIPPVRRSASGYRLFTILHLDCLRLARLALQGQHPGSSIRKSSIRLVKRAASGDLGGALELAYQHHALVQSEQAHAESAANLLQRWAEGAAADTTQAPLQIGQVARLLGVTIDMLRNWERNNLLHVPRNPQNGYRLYGARDISRLRVIRMLTRAGYSTMAVLRMLIHLDQGFSGDLKLILDTPRPDEDVYSASDRWLSTLAEQEQRARRITALLEEMIQQYNAPETI